MNASALPFRYYAAFLDLRGRECLVVGGGEVGWRKVAGLLEGGARVTVVSPDAVAALRQLAETDQIRWLARDYERGDAGTYFLIIAATDDPAVQRAVFQDAGAAGRPCNVVDVPELCSFIVPALLHRGEVTVAVSTGGASPTLAQRIRDRIAACIGEEYGRMAALLRELRPRVHERWRDPERRRAVWSRLVDSRALELLRNGREMEAQRLTSKILEEGDD